MPTRGYTRPPKVSHVVGYFVLWVALGGSLGWVFSRTGSRNSNLFVYLVLFAVLGGLYLVYLVHRLIMRSRVESPQLTVLNARPCLGERLVFDVRLSARRPVTIRRVSAVLSCQEVVRKALRHEKILPVVVERIEVDLAERRRLKAGEPVDVPGEIIVPREGMQSFESHLCAVKWQLDVLVFVGRHLAHQEREVLSVQPVRLVEGEVVS